MGSNRMDKLAQRRPRHHPGTASRLFSGEAVIITPRENMVRMLNPVGSRIWELSDGSLTVGEIVATLVNEFDVEPAHARRTTADFLAMLDDKNLITWVVEG